MTKKDARAKVVEPIEVIGYNSESSIYQRSFTVGDVLDSCLSIKAAQSYLKVAYPQYVRKLLIEGRLEGIKLPLKGYSKWFITKDSLEAYKGSALRRFKPRRYTLWVSSDKEAQIRTLLEAEGISFKLELAYQTPKTKKDLLR